MKIIIRFIVTAVGQRIPDIQSDVLLPLGTIIRIGNKDVDYVVERIVAFPDEKQIIIFAGMQR